jgi:hypothetical protein
MIEIPRVETRMTAALGTIVGEEQQSAAKA